MWYSSWESPGIKNIASSLNSNWCFKSLLSKFKWKTNNTQVNWRQGCKFVDLLLCKCSLKYLPLVEKHNFLEQITLLSSETNLHLINLFKKSAEKEF